MYYEFGLQGGSTCAFLEVFYGASPPLLTNYSNIVQFMAHSASKKCDFVAFFTKFITIARQGGQAQAFKYVQACVSPKPNVLRVLSFVVLLISVML